MVENRHNIQTRWGEKRYHSMDYDLKKRYGEKVYRIALDGGMTCPNRDGSVGRERSEAADVFSAAPMDPVTLPVPQAARFPNSLHMGNNF